MTTVQMQVHMERERRTVTNEDCLNKAQGSSSSNVYTQMQTETHSLLQLQCTYIAIGWTAMAARDSHSAL